MHQKSTTAILLLKRTLQCLSLFPLISFGTTLNCPDLLRGESELDCPWAGLVRLHEANPKVPFEKILAKHAPKFLEHLKSESNTDHSAWGLSRNVDESKPDEFIVSPKILASLSKILKWPVPDPTFRVVHAGLNHTYGYLFSNLKTPYGFKRARYVSGEIERGLKMTPGLFSGLPPSGTLFSNFTKLLLAPPKSQRIEETLRLENPARTITFFTDLVFFDSTHTGPNRALLIYSIADSESPRSEVGLGSAKLITAFPVTEEFAQNLLTRKIPVRPRYNAFVKNFPEQP